MLKSVCDPQKRGGEVVTMWIPTPSMTLPQRMVLYGTCVVALVNSVGLLVLLVQQNQQQARLEQAEARLTEVEQSSVVEFLQEVPRGGAGMRASMEGQQQQYRYQYSRNKRSGGLEKELEQELKELHQVEGLELHQQEVSQEVGEETEKKMKHEVKHKHRHSQSYHKAHVQDDMMTMMTYSMVPDPRDRLVSEPLILDPSLPGTNGMHGHNGTDGVPGLNGQPGADGKRGKRGEQGEKGETGEKGERGHPGPPGEKGQPSNDVIIEGKSSWSSRTSRTHGPSRTSRPSGSSQNKAPPSPPTGSSDPGIASFQNNNSDIVDVRKFYQGCGHTVHNGSFYYHIAGTSSIARFDFHTKRLHTLTIDNALYHNLAYLLHNSKTYFKLAADENGLWLIFASSVDETIMVAQLDQKTFSITSYINTTYPCTKAGNAFIACGVLYVTDTKDTRVTFAFDLLKGKPVNVTFDLRSPGGVLAMLSYSPKDRHLYVWDHNYVRLYVVHFISDE
ncbi:hypothetical protein PAMA_000675 [Pampus argenteus]